MSFQRARSAEQREVRRRAILDTAASMLREMPLAEVSLNELSRRVGLAKSNVLRYFDSREAVLLELLDDFLGEWLDALEKGLEQGVDGDGSAQERAHQLADVLSRSLAERVVMCDLFGAQGGVLEHNVSVETVKRHKRSSHQQLSRMIELVRGAVPEVADGAELFCLMTLVSAGALSAYVPPPASLLAAYEQEPELGKYHPDFVDALRAGVTASLVGVLPRD